MYISWLSEERKWSLTFSAWLTVRTIFVKNICLMRKDIKNSSRQACGYQCWIPNYLGEDPKLRLPNVTLLPITVGSFLYHQDDSLSPTRDVKSDALKSRRRGTKSKRSERDINKSRKWFLKHKQAGWEMFSQCAARGVGTEVSERERRKIKSISLQFIASEMLFCSFISLFFVFYFFHYVSNRKKFTASKRGQSFALVSGLLLFGVVEFSLTERELNVENLERSTQPCVLSSALCHILLPSTISSYWRVGVSVTCVIVIKDLSVDINTSLNFYRALFAFILYIVKICAFPRRA